MWNPQQQQQPQQVAKHEAPIKSVEWSEGIQCLVTGSWDKTMKYWDIRQGKCASSLNLPERVYAMRTKEELAVVATADNQVLIFDIRKPNQPTKVLPSPLKYQTRCLAIDNDKSGFAIGSIEGRVGIHVFNETYDRKSFAFRCHRVGNDVFAINSLDFHPQYNTLATAGADGAFHIWDKISKQRLGKFKESNKPITSCRFNRDGSIFAYAFSYDWSKGYEFYKKDEKSFILLTSLKPEEVIPKKK
jgi:mRNA export factor